MGQDKINDLAERAVDFVDNLAVDISTREYVDYLSIVIDLLSMRFEAAEGDLRRAEEEKDAVAEDN